MMTRERADMLAAEILSSIHGYGLENHSGYYEVARETIGGTDYIGLVDAYLEHASDAEPDEAGDEALMVYSIALSDDGVDICEPEWESVPPCKSKLADFLLQLANMSFRRSEMERLVEVSL